MPYPDINCYLSNSRFGDFSELLEASQEDLTRLNELLNNDVEIRGTAWEGANFQKVTEQYQALTAAMNQSPLMQSISKEITSYLFVASFDDTHSALPEQALDFFIKNKKIILSAGWPGHAVLMELIDTGKSIQILVYNSGEGINAHGNPKSVANKTKYPPVYALTVNATLSSIKPKDLQKVIDEHADYPLRKYKRFRWRDWREYTPKAILFRKKCLAYCRLKHFFKMVFDRKSGASYSDPGKYYADLNNFFKEKNLGISLPTTKRMSLSGLDLHATPHRSGGCSIKVWFSAFQRFRAALDKLPPRKRKRYYHAETNLAGTEDYAVTRLKTKCVVAFLAIKKQHDSQVSIALGDAQDNHKIIQNLLDAIRKLSPAQAAQFIKEKTLLDELNHWLVADVLPALRVDLTSQPKQLVVAEPPLGNYARGNILRIETSSSCRTPGHRMFALSGEAIQLAEIARWDFKSLEQYRYFAQFLRDGFGGGYLFKKHPLLLDQAIQHYAATTAYEAPAAVDSLSKVSEWIAYQFEIINTVIKIQESDKFESNTSVQCALIAEKIYLSIFRTLQKHCDEKHFDVSKLFNLERFNLENYAGFLGTPELKVLARNNEKVRGQKIDYCFNPPRQDWTHSETLTWVLDFSKSMGCDLLELFSAYCRDQKITVKFNRPDGWGGA